MVMSGEKIGHGGERDVQQRSKQIYMHERSGRKNVQQLCVFRFLSGPQQGQKERKERKKTCRCWSQQHARSLVTFTAHTETRRQVEWQPTHSFRTHDIDTEADWTEKGTRSSAYCMCIVITPVYTTTLLNDWFWLVRLVSFSLIFHINVLAWIHYWFLQIPDAPHRQILNMQLLIWLSFFVKSGDV